jgi:hypothetical protein
VIITRHAAQRFRERVHALQDAKYALEDLYLHSLPANWMQRLTFGVVEAQPETFYRRALYFHPVRQRHIDVLLVIRCDRVVTVLIRTSQYKDSRRRKRTRAR